MRSINITFTIAAITVLFIGVIGCNGKSGIVHKDDWGITVRTDSTEVQIIFCSPSVVRIVKNPGGGFSSRESLAVINKKIEPVDFSVEENQNLVVLYSRELKVTLNKISGKVKYYNNKGKLILAEKESAVFSHSRITDDSYQIQQKFCIRDREGLYGLGQHQYGSMNYNGESLTLAQDNKVAVVPFLVSSYGYGLLWDNYSLSRFGNPQGPQLIPANHLYTKDGEPGGLTGFYFSDLELENHSATRIDSVINIDMQYKPNKGIDENAYLQKYPLPVGISPDTLSVRWEGEIKSLNAGEYKIFIDHDDGVRLWIDGKKIIEAWEFGVSEELGKIELEKNKKYSIRLEWFNKTWNGEVSLKWIPPSPEEQSSMSFWSEVADEVDYYFVYGPEPDSVIAGYRELTGTAPLYGKWAYGLWQCKEHYHTQEELLGVLKKYRKLEIPVDNIVQDWYYWDPFPWGSHTFDSRRYPDPEAMIGKVHEMNANFMISVWPKFDVGGANYQALRNNGYLYPSFDDVEEWPAQAYYDAFNPEARQMYWFQLRDSLFSKGVDAWWLDATEPEISKPFSTDSVKKRMDNFLGCGSRYLNAYSLLNSKGVYEGQRAETDDKRVFILTRSAFAGQQRFASTTWSGDISASWNVYRKQISAGLNFSISGIPYWTSDIGGFFVNYPDPASHPEYRELFTRWFQYGAFCPVFRVHGTHVPREMWEFGSESFDIQLKFDKLRYRLLPYIYALAGQVTHEHYTIMRPLVMDFSHDEQVLNIADQYMFGPTLLINPVTKYGAIQRQLYLPEIQGGWYDFWTGEHYEGGREVIADAPLETIPVFAKAGSILPMGPFLQYSSEKKPDPIEIRVYSGADGDFVLYEDESDGYGYETGNYSNIPIKWVDQTKTLTVGAREGNFSGMLKEREFNIVLVGKGHGIGIGTTTPNRTVIYRGREITLAF